MRQKTTDETLRTLHSDCGEIYVISRGRRRKLADCKIDIEIVERATSFRARNPRGYDVKRRYVSLVFCLDSDVSESITDDVFADTEEYEIYCGIEKNIGEYKKIKLDHLLEESVDLYENEWEFRIEDQETVRRLLAL